MIRSLSFKNTPIYVPENNSGRDSTSATPYMDEFVSGYKEGLKNYKEPKSPFFWSPTASIICLTGFLAYEWILLHKTDKVIKNGIEKVAKKKLLKNGIYKLLGAGAITIAGILGLQKLFGMNTDKKYEKVKHQFNEMNTSTNAFLSDTLASSKYIEAFYSIDTGKISVNKDAINDPIRYSRMKKLLKHELVHAKQFELIAASNDGIKKLNYAYAKKIVSPILNQSGDDLRVAVSIMANELKNDTNDKYSDSFIPKSNVSLRDYILAADAIYRNEIDDIPMLIDEEYYKKAAERIGKLSDEDENKASAYLAAYEIYGAADNLGLLNPFSKEYRKNLLEKEAYKAQKK